MRCVYDNLTTRIRHLQVSCRLAFVWIDFSPSRKPYRIVLQFTHKNGDCGAINFCADLLSGEAHRISVHTIMDSFWCRHEKLSYATRSVANTFHATRNRVGADFWMQNWRLFWLWSFYVFAGRRHNTRWMRFQSFERKLQNTYYCVHQHSIPTYLRCATREVCRLIGKRGVKWTKKYPSP